MLYNLMACDERARAPRFFEISHMAFIAPPNHSKEERENDVRIQEVSSNQFEFKDIL